MIIDIYWYRYMDFCEGVKMSSSDLCETLWNLAEFNQYWDIMKIQGVKLDSTENERVGWLPKENTMLQNSWATSIGLPVLFQWFR